MTLRLKPLILILSLLLVVSFQNGYCFTTKFIEEGPIHEALITKVSDDWILESTPIPPPPAIQEKKPRKVDLQADWIPGYWTWDIGRQDFIWVSGVWRRPPPNHSWISGYWKKFDYGWAWVQGFWSRNPEANLVYIGSPPPDPLDENTAPPPSNHFFWSQGYWAFLFDQHEYKWVSGRWEEFDENWMFVPSHYVWRPGGYVFVPAYWDWPLEYRGTAYAAAIIPPADREGTTFEPLLILKPATIVRNLLPFYPDFLSFFQYQYHFQTDFWKNNCCAPPWWKWDSWWCFSPQDQWGLWWWYTHPGYPQPTWLTPEVSAILPPMEELVTVVSKVVPPVIVTPSGVVSQHEILEAIRKSTGQFLPIIPTDQKSIDKLYKTIAAIKPEPRNQLRPIGRNLPLDPTNVRPNIRKPMARQEVVSNNVKILDELRPHAPTKPKIPGNGRAMLRNPQPTPQDQPVYLPPVRRPSWSPKPQVQETIGKGSDVGGISEHQQIKPRGDIIPADKKWRLMKPKEDHMMRPPVHKE